MSLPPEIAAEFPVIALFVIIFMMMFSGIAMAVRWTYARYKEIRDADLAWRAEQNKTRDAAIEKRDSEWRDFFTVLNKGNTTDIDAMRETAAHMIKTLDQLLSIYTVHDTRAQSIQKAVEAIKVDVAKLTAHTGNERKATG